MGGIPKNAVVSARKTSERIRDRAHEALSATDLSALVNELIESDTVENKAATAALRAVLAENAADYLLGAAREAKKRSMRLGAAAVIIAAHNHSR